MVTKKKKEKEKEKEKGKDRTEKRAMEMMGHRGKYERVFTRERK
jgi:hypothetical protein